MNDIEGAFQEAGLGNSDERHACPWPECTREASAARFWGCPAHWNMLPWSIKQEWIKHHEGPERPVIAQRIDEYIKRLRAGLAPLPNAKPAAQVPAATATASEDETFACGWTTDGDLFLFWPRAREFMLLTAAHAMVLKRLFEGPR